jgi:hypothetical protein
MKTAEERLSAAARDAGHIFPADGDLPPLRLPDHAGGRRHTGARVARRVLMSSAGRTRVWLAPLAAAAAVALVSAGVVVLHQSAGRPLRGHTTSGQASERAIQLRHRQQLALAILVIDAYAPATGPQYDRGTKLIWMIQAAELPVVARCMAQSGYHVSARPAPFDPTAYADNTQMPDLPRIARTHEFVPIGGVEGASYTRAEQHAYTICWGQAEVPFRPLRAASAPLQNAWWKVIFRIQAAAQVRAALPALSACASRYGFPNDPYGNTSGPIRSFADFMDWIAGFMDGAGSRGASVSTMRALARHWTAVFVTCAGPIVSVWERMQLAAQPGFLARHDAQLRELYQLAWKLLGSQLR